MSNRATSRVRAIARTVGDFVGGVGDSIAQTATSASRWVQESVTGERRAMLNDLLVTGDDGITRAATVGEQREMTEDAEQAANDFIAAREQARQDWWAENGTEGEYLFIPELYLVRGANLRCDKGTHIRKLNIPKDHAAYITREPMIHKLDCVPSDKENITTFGVCESDDIYNLSPRPPTITLQRRKYNEHNGDLMDSEEDLGNVRGPACTPTIVGTWMRTHNDTRIVDNGDKDPTDKDKDNDDPTKGYPAATTESFLVCYCGGFISPVSCGQNFDLRPQQEQSNETET